MSWRPLPHRALAEAIVRRPHTKTKGDDLPLDLGDKVFIKEQGGIDGDWFRGYLQQLPSLLSALSPLRNGQGLEERVYEGTFPRNCVEIKGIQFENEVEEQSSQNGNSRDSLGQITSADRAQQLEQLKKEILEQIETNTLPVADQDPEDEKPDAPIPHLKAVEDPSISEEPLVAEIKSCVEEWWSNNYHKLIRLGNYEAILTIDRFREKLVFFRQQLQSGVLTEAEAAKVRERAIWKMNLGNKILNGECVVRSAKELGKLMDSTTSPIELSSIQAKMSLLNEVPTPQAVEKTAMLNHILMEIKDYVNASSNPTILKFGLVTKCKTGEPNTLTECFSVDCKQGSFENLTAKTRAATLFADLTAADIGETPADDSFTWLLIKAEQTHVPIPIKPWEGRDSASMSRESLATPFHAANIGSINAGKSSVRRSMMLSSVTGSVKNVFKSPTKNKSPTKLNTLQEAFEPPTTGEGRLSTSSSVTPPGTPGKAVSRTVAVGVLNFTKILKKTDGEHHAKVQLWIPSPAFDGNPQNKGSDWDEIIRCFLGSPIGSYRKMPTMDKIDLVIKPYLAQNSESLIRNKPTELSGVTPTPKLGFSGAPRNPRNDVYVTIVQPNFPEKALISRATGSATALSQRSEFKNIQVRLEVHNKSGFRIENAIYASSNSQALTAYDSTVIEKNGVWNETVRLAISPDDVEGAHLVMFTSDAPGYPFAVSHLPLWHEDAFVRDGNHALLMYKNEEARAVSETTNKWYLNVRSSARASHDARKDEALTGPLSTLRIRTFLCSTAMSQDKVILGLLNWKTREQAEVVNGLKQILFCPEIEVVKQLDDVLDSLFAILVEHSENETFEDLAFTALVHVLTMAFDRRFNLSPLVDKYADEKFSFPFATPCLVRSYNRLLVATDPASATKLRGTLKVTKHVFKFINRGRTQMIGKEADIGITNGSNGFINQLNALFTNLNSLMRSNEPRLIANQTIAVQHFHSWLPELSPMLSHDQIVFRGIDFIDAMIQAKGKLANFKIQLIIKFSELEVFTKDMSALTHNTVRWIKPYWGEIDGPLPTNYRDQVRLCCTVLATQIDDLGNLAENHLPNIIDSYLALLNGPKPLRTTDLSLLFPRTYPFPVKPIDNKDDEFDEALIELAAIFSAISSSEHGLQLDNIRESKEDLANLVYNTLKVQESILNAEAFPKTWLSLHVYHHRSAMGTLNQVAQVLLENFLPIPEELSADVVFLDALWKLFFKVLLNLVTSDTLALECFAQQKRRAVWTIGGDVRKEGAKLLSKMWHALGWDTDNDDQTRFGLARMGGFQVQFTTALAPATLVMCMHMHEDLCAAGTEVLKSMIASEWQLNESVAGIKTVIIDCLDSVFKSKSFNEGDVRKDFLEDILQHFDSRFLPEDDEMWIQIREMLYSINEFLDLLNAVHTSGTADEANQMIHRLALMKFLRDMDKTDTFIAYAHQLAGVQAAAGNFTEAGLALRHHADIYTWDPAKILPPITEPSYPSQTEFERKESLYHDMIQRFEEGEAWDTALEAYRELAIQYGENVFDFKKLARTQKAMGTIHEKISRPDRPLTRFFHVCFGGLGFSAELTMNQYVYEGKPGQELPAFSDKIQEDYADAQIIKDVEDFQEQEGQYISIDVCTPLRETGDLINQRTKVPNVVKEYLATRHAQSFTISRKKVFAGSVHEHYIDQIVLHTEEAFPTISRRSQIIDADLRRLDAVETAIYRVQRLNKMLAAYEKGWFVHKDVAIYNKLVDLLKQEIEISVNKKAVIATRALLPSAKIQEFLAENMSHLDASAAADEAVELNDHQLALKTALIDEAIIINRIVSNFELSDAQIVRTQGTELRPQFEKTFNIELASIAPKSVVKVEDYQRPWNFQTMSNGNSQRTASPVKGNRASNLSTLGPLPSMAPKPQMYKSRTSSSMASTDSSRSSMAGKAPTTLRRAGSFIKQFVKSDKDSDAASGKENQKPGKKLKRGPPVAFKGASNSNSGAKSTKRRESDAASTKSSRKSMGSFSRHSFFGRNRANINASEDMTDDGNSEWTDEQSSRFVSNPDENRGIFTGRGDRYISDSIRRDTSSVFSTLSLDDPTSLNQYANLSQEQQVKRGAVSRLRSDSVTSVSSIYTDDLEDEFSDEEDDEDHEVSDMDVESPSKDSDEWGDYNYDTIRPVKPRSYLSPEKNLLGRMFSEPSGDFSAPGFSGILGIKRSRPKPAYRRTFGVKRDGTNGELPISISEMSFDDPNMSFNISDVESITSDEIREEQARRRIQKLLRSTAPAGRRSNGNVMQTPPGLVIPPFRPRRPDENANPVTPNLTAMGFPPGQRRSTVSSIGSLGSDDTNPFDPTDVPIRHYDKPATRLASLTESEAARKRAEGQAYQERATRESLEQSQRNQEEGRRLEAEYDAKIAREKQQEQMRRMEEMDREAYREFGPFGPGNHVPPMDEGYQPGLYEGGYYWKPDMEAPGNEAPLHDPRYRPDDHVDFSPRFEPAYHAGYNPGEYEPRYDGDYDGGYQPAENPYNLPNMVSPEEYEDGDFDVECFRFLPHNPANCVIPNCGQQLCYDYHNSNMGVPEEKNGDAFDGDIFRVEPHNPAGCYDPHCGQQACEEYAGPRVFSSPEPEEEEEDSRLHDFERESEVGDNEDAVRDTLADTFADTVDEMFGRTPLYGSVDNEVSEVSTPPSRSPYKPPHIPPLDSYGPSAMHPGYHTMGPQYNSLNMPPPMDPYGAPMHPGYRTMGPQQNPFNMPPTMGMGPDEYPMHPGGYQTMGPQHNAFMGPSPPMHPPQDPFGPPPMGPFENPMHLGGYHTMHPQQDPFGPPPMGPYGNSMHPGYQTMHQQQNPFMQPPMGMGPEGFPMHPMGYQTMPPMRPPPGFGFPDPYEQPMGNPYMQGIPVNPPPQPMGPPPGLKDMDAPHEDHRGFHGPSFRYPEPQGMGAASPRYAYPQDNPLQHVFEPPSSPPPPVESPEPEQWPSPPPGFGLPRQGGLLVSKDLLDVGKIHTAPSENDFLRWEAQGLPFVETMRKAKKARGQQPPSRDEVEAGVSQQPFQLFSSPQKPSPGAPRMRNASPVVMHGHPRREEENWEA